MTWDDWIGIFVDHCRNQGYYGPIDRETFRENWERNDSPEATAEDFVEEMQG